MSEYKIIGVDLAVGEDHTIRRVAPITSINNVDHFKREMTYKPLTPKEGHSFKDVLENILEDSDRE